MITFDPDSHTYYENGERVLGVSEILKASGLQDLGPEFPGMDEILANAADRGKVIHEAIRLLNEGDLDWDTVDEEILPYLECWQTWAEKVDLKPIQWETAMSARHYLPWRSIRYAGTVDLVAYVFGKPTVVDIKTGSSGLRRHHRYQLAAYRELVQLNESLPAYVEVDPLGTPPVVPITAYDRLIVHLRPRKTAMEHYLEYYEEDIAVFHAALTVADAKEKKV